MKQYVIGYRRGWWLRVKFAFSILFTGKFDLDAQVTETETDGGHS